MKSKDSGGHWRNLLAECKPEPDCASAGAFHSHVELTCRLRAELVAPKLSSVTTMVAFIRPVRLCPRLRDYSRFKITVSGEPKFASFFLHLSDEQLRKRIDDVLNSLKEHPDNGDLVERALWPDAYRKLALDNLFRIEVGRGQRMTYAIRIVGDDLDVDVIEFFRTHKEYARRFHY